jgi:hypothetical protein
MGFFDFLGTMITLSVKSIAVILGCVGAVAYATKPDKSMLAKEIQSMATSNSNGVSGYVAGKVVSKFITTYGNIYFHFNIFRSAKYIKSEKYAPYASTSSIYGSVASINRTVEQPLTLKQKIIL